MGTPFELAPSLARSRPDDEALVAHWLGEKESQPGCEAQAGASSMGLAQRCGADHVRGNPG
eukprot:14391204-Alexandrium_andersonii.AAC.1